MNNQEKGNSFVSFLLETGSLVFREFTLKSGRVSPYFFNLGRLNTGRELARIGEFYADKIVAEWGDDFDIIFGPAYKGIPLAVSVVSALYAKYNLVKKYSSNRKDVKTYADASSLLGSDVSEGDKIILVDDASSDGTADLAKSLGLKIFRHQNNLGYGGNQKTCYQKALAAEADIVVMVHPDHQYDHRTG